ncbi:MAG: hypothetical protein E6559_13390, partial [Pantoea sp.]|nr:hypothetical protein [Pantoea sp.]
VDRLAVFTQRQHRVKIAAAQKSFCHLLGPYRSKCEAENRVISAIGVILRRTTANQTPEKTIIKGVFRALR